MNRRLAEESFAALQRSGIGRCELVHDNIVDGQALAGRRFDLVFARFVLVHQRDPLAVLRRMWGWVAPGGALLVLDYDLGQIPSWPPFEPAQELRRLACGTIETAGCDPRIGIKLPHYLREATELAPEDVAVFGALRLLGERKPFMLHGYRSFVPRALEMGLTTRDEVARFERAWLQAGGDECYVQNPTLVSAWVRREQSRGEAQ